MLHCHFYMAVWLPLFGMNPCLLSEKESSYSSDNTCASAVCCVRSDSVDISSGLFSPLGFGIFSRLIGNRLVSAASNGFCLLMWGAWNYWRTSLAASPSMHAAPLLDATRLMAVVMFPHQVSLPMYPFDSSCYFYLLCATGSATPSLVAAAGVLCFLRSIST